MMATVRSVAMAVAVSAAMLVVTGDAFARGGRGGGGGGRGGGGGGRGGGGGGGMGGSSGQQMQPQQSQENPTITADKKDLSTLRTAQEKAQREYNDALVKFEKEYEKSPEYADAQKGLEEATKGVNAARDALIEKLKAQPDYKAALAKESDAKKKLDTMRNNGASRDQISSQSKVILDAGDAVGKMEKKATDSDAAYADAMKKVAEAKAALQVQKDAMAAKGKEDDALSKLKATVDDGTAKIAAAQKKLEDDSRTAAK